MKLPIPVGATSNVILEMIHQRERRIRELLVGLEKCINALHTHNCPHTQVANA